MHGQEKSRRENVADDLLLTGELLLGDRDITVQQQWQQHTTPHLKQTLGAGSATWQERKHYLPTVRTAPLVA